MEQGEIDRIKADVEKDVNLRRDVDQLDSRLRRLELGAGGFILWVLSQMGDKLSALLNFRIGGE